VRDVNLWRSLLGVEKTVVARVEFDQDSEVLVASGSAPSCAPRCAAFTVRPRRL